MIRDLKKSMTTRIGLWFLLCLILIAVSNVTRIFLLVKSFNDVELTVLNTLGVFIIGLFFDVVNAIYFSLPFVLFLWLMPNRIFRKRGHRFVLYTLVLILSFIILFNGVGEWLFWDEFNVRFNFIAVDYLVYTTEVIGNISQSFPLEWIIAAIVLASFISLWTTMPVINASNKNTMTFRQRTVYMSIYLLLFTLALVGVNSKYHHFSRNAYVNELAGNGMYELFAAYRNNELNYDQFYKVMDNANAFVSIRKQIKTAEAEFTNADTFSITRNIVNHEPENKMNVVMISVESFSADFMKLFGNTEGITPFLDSLSAHSLTFTNLYATGTRTVRGLEALSLCVPPTPGQSIVRRPDNEGLFSLGKVFSDKGYATEYIYGGYSYFDNMGYFFGNNSYQVIDRSALNDEEIAYENIWGVADENLFDLALRELDTNSRTKPVFTHIMTTSNHRPFTYPDERIDIPSHTNRSGAVKYTDYAIGRFIKEAQRHDWFDNTLFIIVADHCASSAGKTELPVNKYHIPMLIYSPSHVQPAAMNRLMSQIDIGPTILGMLNFSYVSKFYGYDMFKLEPGRERAFISTYQSLGYLKDGKLAILTPRQKVESFRLSQMQETTQIINDPELVNEAIAWYQSASYAFKHGFMK